LFLTLQEAASSYLQALQFAIEHPAISTDPKALCTSARICKAWRHAVQQCRACNTAIDLSAPDLIKCYLATSGFPSAPQLRSFAQWLPKHAGLVRSIRSQMRLQMSQLSNEETALGGVLHKALQAAAAAPAAMPETAALRAASELEGGNVLKQDLRHPHHQQQEQSGWCLTSFSCNLPGAAAMLDALPAHSLTHLELGVSHSCDVSGAELAVSLARLSSLQRLCIESQFVLTERIHLPSDKIGGIDGSYLRDGVGKLAQLTSLSLTGFYENVQPVEQLLQQLLPRLQQLLLLIHRPLTKQNLAHLTQLQEIASGASFPITDTAVLPTQLKRLQLYTNHGPRLLRVVSPLQQLQQLKLEIWFPEPQFLLQLVQLPALQHLALEYKVPRYAASAAAAWPLLPQLQELRVGPGDYTCCPTRVEMASLLAGVAGSTALTRLRLECCAGDYARGEPRHIGDSDRMADAVHTAVCPSLAGLSRLKELQ
jgi:hypothetical protein